MINQPSKAASGFAAIIFFSHVRKSVFGGALAPEQVDGMERILAYRAKEWPKMPDAELAYVLATVAHETGRKMIPVVEAGGLRYLRSKPYWPWVGRGLVQVTWQENYKKFGVAAPEDALKWDVSLDVCFRGMVLGMFTGRKLSDFISSARCNYVGARRIINGTDRARQIAAMAIAFREALAAAQNGASKGNSA